VLGISEGAAKVRAHRGMSQLREALAAGVRR
jgi:DNA-directed RNA polymerase specialized sigma24 family protein